MPHGHLDLHAGVRVLGALVRALLPRRRCSAAARRARAPPGRRHGAAGHGADEATRRRFFLQCETAMTDFGLIIVGDEILSGKRADKHMPKVIELLAARGLLAGAGREYVGDDPTRITGGAQARLRLGATSSSRAAASAPRPTTTRARCAGRALGRAARAAPRGPRPDPPAHAATSPREQGVPFEPDRRRQRPPAQHGRVPAKAPRSSRNPYNRIAGFGEGGRRRRVLRAGLPGDGLADDRVGARRAPEAPASARTP